jgi:hypothetical protein
MSNPDSSSKADKVFHPRPGDGSLDRCIICPQDARVHCEMAYEGASLGSRMFNRAVKIMNEVETVDKA